MCSRLAAPLRLDPRRLFEYNGQRHHPLVQRAHVLDVIDHQGRNRLRRFCEEDGRSRNARNLARSQLGEELLRESSSDPSSAVMHAVHPGAPGAHDEEHARAESQRQPAAFRDLQQIRIEERNVHHQEHTGDRERHARATIARSGASPRTTGTWSATSWSIQPFHTRPPACPSCRMRPLLPLWRSSSSSSPPGHKSVRRSHPRSAGC